MRCPHSWPDLSYSEFACDCGCESNLMAYDYIDWLQGIRTLVDKPFVIASGYRCHNHPLELDCLRPSEHTFGVAAEIVCDMQVAREILSYATVNPVWTGIGIQQKGELCLLHLDMAESVPYRPRPALWTY